MVPGVASYTIRLSSVHHQIDLPESCNEKAKGTLFILRTMSCDSTAVSKALHAVREIESDSLPSEDLAIVRGASDGLKLRLHKNHAYIMDPAEFAVLNWSASFHREGLKAEDFQNAIQIFWNNYCINR